MIRIPGLTVILFLLLLPEAMAQSPYSLSWEKEATISSIGLGTLAGAYIISRGVEPLTAQEIGALDSRNIIAFDRSATSNYSSGARKASDYLMVGAYLTPLALMAGSDMRRDIFKLGFIGAETYLLVHGLTQMSKNATLRARPFVYNNEASLEDKQTRNARYSFFSGHTSTAAAMCFFSAKVFSDYHPESKWKAAIWAAAAVIPAATGYMRVKAGKHYPTDVIAGYTVGALTGYLVPHFHKAKDGHDKELSFYVGPNGALINWQF